MNDLYQEILVKKKASAKDTALKILVIAVTVLVLAAGVLFLTPLLLVGLVLCFVDFYFLLPQFDLEYEYLYVNGDIDVDKIMSKSRRKKVASFSKDNLEVMAPTGSAVLNDYLNGAKVEDYSSGEENASTWTLVYSGDKSKTAAILQLPDELPEDMRRYAPRKVYLRQFS